MTQTIIEAAKEIIMVRIFDDDRLLRKVVKEFKEVNKSFVTIGVQGKDSRLKHKKKPKSKAKREDLAKIAFFQEFGTKKIPARSFLGSTFDQNQRELERRRLSLLRAIIDNKISVRKALDTLGNFFQEKVKEKIQDGIPPKLSIKGLSQSQIENRRKNRIRGDTPLIDSGLLVRSITFKTVIK